jgi:uncharacterized damage-inducible protein DinB
MRRKELTCAVLTAVILSAGLAIGTRGQESAAKKEKGPAAVVLEQWNDVGGRLVMMAEDWPADKYGYQPNDKVRTFAQVILHIAGSNYSLINQTAGKKLGNAENDPSTETFKTKAQAVEFLKKSVTDGATAIQQLGDAGVSKHLDAWVGYEEHMGEHYGQLVVYYRNNGMVPPESRPKK